MDSEIIYSLFGIIGLSVVVYMTLKSTPSYKANQSPQEKRAEILSNYRKSLQKSLKAYKKDDEARKAKKVMILREYSEELGFNVFFNEEQAKEVILELSGE